MSIGIGTDIVAISRIASALERQGPKFAARILTTTELFLFQQNNAPARYLAKRFAAKEAILKALGTGLAQGMRWQDIEISRNELGGPVVSLTGAAQARMHALGGQRMLLSLSDEQDLAIAFASLEN